MGSFISWSISSHMFGRNSDFHHLHPFGMQHLVADGRRLNEAVPGMDAQLIPLIFIKDIDPACDAED